MLDEADQMLKLGFKEDVDEILAAISEHTQEKVQILLFSATIPDWVKDIASQYMDEDYAHIDLAKNLQNKTNENITHVAIECMSYKLASGLCKVCKCLVHL